MTKMSAERKGIAQLPVTPLLAGMALAVGLSACRSVPPATPPPFELSYEQMYPSLPPEFRRSGLISSSTYQVPIAVDAKDEEEARELGNKLVRQKAFQLLLQEVFIPKNITAPGRENIRTLVNKNGKIVRIEKASDHRFNLVLQINKMGLHNYLKRIR